MLCFIELMCVCVCVFSCEIREEEEKAESRKRQWRDGPYSGEGWQEAADMRGLVNEDLSVRAEMCSKRQNKSLECLSEGRLWGQEAACVSVPSASRKQQKGQRRVVSSGRGQVMGRFRRSLVKLCGALSVKGATKQGLARREGTCGELNFKLG